MKKAKEEKNEKSQVSYVLGNPNPEKGNISAKDFNQKNEEVQRKIEETEKLLVFFLQKISKISWVFR